jgi:hypothetical protein
MPSNQTVVAPHGLGFSQVTIGCVPGHDFLEGGVSDVLPFVQNWKQVSQKLGMLNGEADVF